ncbi:MAG: methyltransferase domain-containing protein [Candidatus Riflebacteria bacterium]|nr:methyltransferase domain-containing protein [Candidatus Riflebacteria bacterium]
MITSTVIRQTYDRCSSFYDLFFKPWLEFGRRQAVDALMVQAGDTVLEIGVGTGLSFEFYPPDIRVVGFDYSHGMLQGSKEKAVTAAPCAVDLLQMDVQAMAFPEGSFDRVMAAYVLTVVPDIHRAIAEILRVARPGARVVLLNHLRSTNPLLSWIEDTFHPLFARIGLFTLDRDLLSILESFDLLDLQVEPTSWFGLHHVISFTVPGR